MDTLDVIVSVLLVAGNLLALPLWWHLFGAPLLPVWRWIRHSTPSLESHFGPQPLPLSNNSLRSQHRLR